MCTLTLLLMVIVDHARRGTYELAQAMCPGNACTSGTTCKRQRPQRVFMKALLSTVEQNSEALVLKVIILF